MARTRRRYERTTEFQLAMRARVRETREALRRAAEDAEALNHHRGHWTGFARIPQPMQEVA